MNCISLQIMLYMSELTSIIRRHRSQIIVELSSPLICWFQFVNFEQIIQKRQQHGIVVREHEQVHCQQVCARLQITKRMACISISSGSLDENLPTVIWFTVSRFVL